VREADGLAMSSRNAYLSAEERKLAPLLHRVIIKVAEAAGGRGGTAADAIADGTAALEATGFKVDYLEVRDAETLKPAAPGAQRPLRVLVAAWLGKTRLIDNVDV
jgi:pantoate--beta-alanine ligase